MIVCIECGTPTYNNTEICQNCMDRNNAGTMNMDMGRQSDMTMACCAGCQRVITADSIQCTSCTKNYHRSCDSYDSSSLHGFVCSQCRRRDRLLSDDLMLSASAAPRGVNAPLSPFSDPAGQQIDLQMPSGPMTSSYPTSSDFGVEMYSQMSSSSMQQHQQQIQIQHMLATQTQLMDEISDGATNDSDRNSSPFYQETSDYDEDFIPVSTRGRGRGGGGAKKKPGRGQSTGMRRQTNPGPSTAFYSATTVHTSMTTTSGIPPPPTTRGKRGKRGTGTTTPNRSTGKGTGRGRGRGRGNSNVNQQVQYTTSSSTPMGHPNTFPYQIASSSSSGPSALPIGPSASSSNVAQLPMIPSMNPQPSVSSQVPVAAPNTPSVAPENIVPNFQLTSQPVVIREVDESMMEDETSRQSGGSRADEQEYVRTAVVCRINDEFLQKACLCLLCGSIGKGAEGSMVACSNCAQTYHTYCVNLHDKLNAAVIQRGWRCLDCTVCEGCGTGGDESKLILCDECDISYHIYCLKPPLERIPQGPWRCQWCSRCRRCNHKASSGNDLTSQGLCHPCASLRKCPQCHKGYQLNEKIIRCSQCSKWQHGHCEGLFTDEQLEQAATNRMRCSTCRPNRTQSIGFLDAENVVVCDNVALNKHSDEILKSKYTPSALKHHMLEAYGYHRESFDHCDEEGNADDSSELIVPPPTGTRGRGRGNPGGRRGTNRIGVGGFYAKLPRHRMLALQEEAQAALGDDDNEKKTKRPRKPRRSQLEDAYPPPIQEAFFGIRAVEGKTLLDMAVEEPGLAEYNKQWNGIRESTVGTLKAHELASDASDMLRNDINENEFLENMDFGNIDTDLDLENIDFSLLIDEDEYNDDFEDSMQGDSEVKEEPADGDTKLGPTNFNNLEQKPSTSAGLPPANFAQQAPGIRAATTLSRSGSQSTDAADNKYQYAERWEEDEPLGLQATTAAVLYANEKHAYLKTNHPEWSDRVKQIQKLWRTLGSNDRLEYVARARENRTNRGKIPRARRNVQSTTSVDSPTIQSPAVNQMGFKVPLNPGDPSASSGIGAPEDSSQSAQVRITHHLPPDVHQQYMEMQRIQKDRENLTHSCDQELNKLRKQKKNLAAKKRQMQKTAQAAQDYDGRPIDLNDNDRQLFSNLTDRIKQVQADLENSKKDLKGHESTLREFELRHTILRRESEVSTIMIQQSEARNQQAHAEHVRAQQAQAQVHTPGAIGPQVPPQGSLAHLQQQRMMPMKPDGQQGAATGGPQQPSNYVRMMPPPGQPMVTPELHRRFMLNLKFHQRRQHRWLEMGGVKYDEITDPVFKDVYEFLDEVLYDITFPMDNPVEAARQQRELHAQALIAAQQHVAQMAAAAAARGEGQPPNMLKRILHHPPGGPPGGPPLHLAMPMNLQPGQVPIPQAAPGASQQMPLPAAQQQDDGPKPKKKRTVQKKVTTSYGTAGGEFGSFVEKIRTRFRLSEELPKLQKEPQLNRIGCEFAEHMITGMIVGVGRKPLIGTGFGKMSIKRGTRLFSNYERRQGVLQFNPVSLYQVDPKIRTVALYNASTPTTSSQEPVFQDEMDKQTVGEDLSPNARILKLINKKRPALEHIRSIGKYMDEAKAPLAPELGMFYQKVKEKEEDVTIELIFNTDELKPDCTDEDKAELTMKLKESFADVVMVKKEISWKLEDTPPASPIPSSPAPSTAGPVTVSEARPTASTSRPPSTSMEKEIKREIEEEPTAGPSTREIKKELIENSGQCKCKYCQKTIESGTVAVRMKMDKLGILSPDASTEEKEDIANFCSRKCYYELMASSRVSLNHEELTAAEQHVGEETYNRLKQIHSDNIVKAVSQGKSKLPCAPSVSSLLTGADGLISPRDTRYMMDEGRKENVSMVAVSSLIGAVEAPKEIPALRQTTDDWKTYDQGVYESFVSIHHQHMHYIVGPKIGVPIPPHSIDKRLCVFCGGIGDGETTKCGRLISLTEYYWVHVNCALWSSEVSEVQNGALVHVDRAVIRAARILCDHCKRPGASLRCYKNNCHINYHLLCAIQCQGHFIKDRTFICKHHEKIAPEVCLNRLDTYRRIVVKRDENKMLMRLFDLSEGDRLCMRLGAFTFYKLGSILPRQIKRFHNKDFIFPNHYRATRLFWSPKNHRERMMFECTIEERNDQPSFIVRSLEDPNISFRASSASKAWSPIFEKVHQMREQQSGESLKFFGSQISGETLFGLNENAITKITESLPGFDTVFTYQQRHQNSPVLELPLAENPMGCARAEPRQRNVGNHFRTRPQPMGGTHHAHHGVVGSSSGQHSHASVVSSSQDLMPTRQAATSLTSANSGRTRGHRSYYTEEAAARAARAYGISPDYASLVSRMEPVQSAQSTFSAYQKMRREWKDRVYLARSRIAGLGLYAKHDISMGEYIIEYKGEIIRSEVCEVREIRYVSQNRGVYMFRIDEEWVIDATMAGGPARYINHSCDPNCSTQIMDAGSGPREKKIIIMANRPISNGEELTYDYQFELEDSADKVPCLCGAPNCVKWMN